jgi:hypothetical protein
MMAKLPTEFLKAPATQPKPRAPRSRKASLISPDPVKNPRELVLVLTEEEYQALEEARHALHAAGAEVTLEQMIHRVFADWMVRARAIVQPPSAPADAPRAEVARDERMLARLRAFVEAPLRTWRELATQVWRRAITPSR